MGLWDALTGRILHWNNICFQSHEYVYPRLGIYLPESHHLRDLLFASYYAFLDCFGQFVFSDEPNLKERGLPARLKSVNTKGLLYLASSYHNDFVFRLIAGAQPKKYTDLATDLVISGSSLYGREELFSRQWLGAITTNDERQALSLLLHEVALVLGLDRLSKYDMEPWFVIRDPIYSVAVNCLKDPHWNSRVTQDLSRPLRVGGYPDSIMK